MNNCLICQKPVKNKYCSPHCVGKASKGGYRNGSGRAKCGYYKGIYCGSTYELAWVIYNIDNKINFKRFEGCLNFNGIRYYPDFIQDNKIIEIKGFEEESKVSKKNEVAMQNGYEITVLRKADLSEQFKWIKEHYNYKKLQELYDGFKPSYPHICDYCKSEFHRYKKILTTLKFCSRSCCGKSRIGLANKKGINQYTK